MQHAIIGKNLVKKYKGFEVRIDELEIPKGFATALIGENGAGKTTLLNMMSGIRLDYDGEFKYFDEELSIEDPKVKNEIGYTSSKSFFLPNWTIGQVGDLSSLLFDGFDKARFYEICNELQIPVSNAKMVKKLSDGNVMKLMLATVLARDTGMLILDEPASPLDPLMRDKLCEMFRSYLNEGDGQKSILFSTHNVADMENVTDYVILMHKGAVVEKGFVEDLKEKYILVKGESEDYDKVKEKLIGGSATKYGFEGLCLAENLECMSGLQVSAETPGLSRICVGILKKYSSLR